MANSLLCCIARTRVCTLPWEIRQYRVYSILWNHSESWLERHGRQSFWPQTHIHTYDNQYKFPMSSIVYKLTTGTKWLNIFNWYIFVNILNGNYIHCYKIEIKCRWYKTVSSMCLALQSKRLCSYYDDCDLCFTNSMFSSAVHLIQKCDMGELVTSYWFIRIHSSSYRLMSAGNQV